MKPKSETEQSPGPLAGVARASGMKVLSAASQLQPDPRKVCAAIGFFDGVHLGHQQVIRQTVEDARQHDGLAVVVTFDRHPGTVVAPDQAPPLIYTLPQKLRTIEALGVDALVLIEFTDGFSRIRGEDFARGLAGDLGRLHSLCVGSTCTFGYRRSGNVALLRRLGHELGFAVHGLAAVSLSGRSVSSTRIREAIQAGDLLLANQMLGRSYAVAGRVQRGDQLGQQLGFPTANLNITGLVLPPPGVFAAQARHQNRLHPAVMNIGIRPTLQRPQPTLQVEVHLLDYRGDLYGQELEVTVVARIRDEQRFPSLEALRAQIALDIQRARQLL
jgi:riboflavin kinase/FMN adenylyltransferase